MKLTKALVREFEDEQRRYGTETAIYNLLWLKAAEDFEALGVRRITTATSETTRHALKA